MPDAVGNGSDQVDERITIPQIDAAVAADLPWLTTAQMVEVDRAMVDDAGITLLQMMELAGRHLAVLARARFLMSAQRGRVVVLAGSGGNGGGALVAARRLASWGFDVRVVLSAAEASFAGVPRHQLDIACRLGIAVQASGEPPSGSATLIIDGLIGYALRGAPRGRASELIAWADASPAPVLALDVPSGLDATTGRVSGPVIHAVATLTLALPKRGLLPAAEIDPVGELYLADIGVPSALYRRAPLALVVPNVFAEADVVRLR